MKDDTGNSQGEKSPIMAAALSFFITGLGQAYNGELKKGAILFLAQGVISVALIASTIAAAFFFNWAALICLPAYLIPLAIWAIGIYDAHRGAKGEPFLKF